jgi:hypothetical protein
MQNQPSKFASWQLPAESKELYYKTAGFIVNIPL